MVLRLVREICMEEEELVMLMLLEAKGRISHILNKQKRRTKGRKNNVLPNQE